MSSTRSDRGFRFPLQKYSDEKALYTNFRYLQEYLNYIRKKDKFAATVDIALRGSDAEARATHLADGTNDHTQIQAAIDALPAAGGHVYFHEGTYNIAGTITLPNKKVILSGPGTLNFQGETSAFGIGITCGSGEYFFEGLTFTGACRNAGQTDRGADVIGGTGTIYVVGCEFNDISGEGILGVSSGTRTFVAVGNRFKTVELRRGSSASDASAIVGALEIGSTSCTGAFVGNYVDGVTTTAAVFGNDTYYLVGNEGGSGSTIIASGNIFQNVSGLSSNFGIDNHSHNVVNGTMIAGSHTGTDHGALSGLTDDDHTQYVLRSILTTAGDLAYRDGSDWARLALGTAGQVLKVNSGATAPEWDDESGGGAAAFSEFLLIGA